MSAWAVIYPPPPPPAEPKPPSRKQRRLARHLAMRDIDHDGDILPFQFGPSARAGYRKRLLERDPHCVFCRKRLDPDKATLDHAMPYSKGGLDSPGNLWLCCQACNRAKADRSALEWLQMIADACVRMGLLPDPEDDDDGSDDDTVVWGDDATTTGYRGIPR